MKWAMKKKGPLLFRVHSGNRNVALEHGPFEDVFPIKHGDIPLLYML